MSDDPIPTETSKERSQRRKFDAAQRSLVLRFCPFEGCRGELYRQLMRYDLGCDGTDRHKYKWLGKKTEFPFFRKKCPRCKRTYDDVTLNTINVGISRSFYRKQQQKQAKLVNKIAKNKHNMKKLLKQ